MSGFPRDLLADLVDDLDVALFFTDADGIVLHINEPASYLVRLPRLTAVGRSLDRLLPQDVAGFLQVEGKEALATGRNRRLSKKALILPGRGLLFYDIRVIPYRRPSDGPWVAYLLLDITAQQRRETASEKARENAEAEARARRAFLARMSHEIRTPMNGIMGMTDLALQARPSEEIGEYLGVIKNAADSLLGIINDVLDFAKVESGRIEPDQVPFDLRAQLDDILTLLRTSAEAKGIALSGSVSSQVPKVLIGDPVRIRQIITNLVANAVKFTEAGSVEVQLESGPRPPDAPVDEIVLAGSVRDTGIGIPADQLEELFEPFAQSDAAKGGHYGGTGLGLAICRTLARMMGGDVDAESGLGEGSVFHFRLRLKVAGEQSTMPENHSDASGEGLRMETLPQWNGARILLAEDNRVNRIVAEHLLDRVGLDVVSCENGLEAVEAFETMRPDLILMDLQMPVVDGMDAARRIRAAESADNRQRTPIIALTAHVLEEERNSAEEAGMDGWVAKPVKPKELYAELARLLPPVVSPP